MYTYRWQCSIQVNVVQCSVHNLQALISAIIIAVGGVVTRNSSQCGGGVAVAGRMQPNDARKCNMVSSYRCGAVERLYEEPNVPYVSVSMPTVVWCAERMRTYLQRRVVNRNQVTRGKCFHPRSRITFAASLSCRLLWEVQYLHLIFVTGFMRISTNRIAVARFNGGQVFVTFPIATISRQVCPIWVWCHFLWYLVANDSK